MRVCEVPGVMNIQAIDDHNVGHCFSSTVGL